jgi:hypothetical protein
MVIKKSFFDKKNNIIAAIFIKMVNEPSFLAFPLGNSAI